MRTEEQLAEDYKTYRGHCRKFCDEAILQDPTLRLVRGYYHCPAWGREPHWWCCKPDGEIVDPTKLQFPSGGLGYYEEFNGMLECANCGKEFPETPDADIEGKYAFCSCSCHMRFVGL